MALTLQRWKQVVKSKYFQSTEFRTLDNAVVQYINTNPKGKAVNDPLVNAWNSWLGKLTKKGKTLQQSDRYSVGCALDDIEQIVANAALALPNSLQAQIAARDALTPDERSGGNHFVKGVGGWQQRIFSQEQNNSCTCACATTFLSKLIDKPVSEDAFRQAYNRINGKNDFNIRGSFLPEIAATMQDFGADAVMRNPATWDDMKGILTTASRENPVLMVVVWGTPGAPTGGAHAVMCIGEGAIQGWGRPQRGFLMEDPWPAHSHPGLLDDATYLVWNSASWSQGYGDESYGCIVGKKSRREQRMGDYRRIGHKVM